MAYSKVNWDETTTPLSPENLNKMDTQYDEAINESNIKLGEHNSKSNEVHGLAVNEYLVKTKNVTQFPDWEEIQNKPDISSFATQQDIDTAVGNVTAESLGAATTQALSEVEGRVSTLEQAGGTGTGGAVILRIDPVDPQEGEIYWKTITSV